MPGDNHEVPVARTLAARRVKSYSSENSTPRRRFNSSALPRWAARAFYSHTH